MSGLATRSAGPTLTPNLMTPNPYGETPYENLAFPDFHPNWPALIAALFDLEVPLLTSFECSK